jgi:hypothetical protein
MTESNQRVRDIKVSALGHIHAFRRSPHFRLLGAETGRSPSRAYPAQRRTQEIDEAAKRQCHGNGVAREELIG